MKNKEKVRFILSNELVVGQGKKEIEVFYALYDPKTIKGPLKKLIEKNAKEKGKKLFSI